MGLEIERARALLGQITRERLLPADAAAKAYERWAAGGTTDAFSRYLIDQGWVEAQRVRLLLRRQAVQGLPMPDQFTRERFEDLLLGQLAIEAELISSKMIGTVRKVQDKKVVEGKLRRLSDLLPRAGLDPKLLDMVQAHLRERILLCGGCLARYPRKDLSQVSQDCPRCGLLIEEIGLESSGELELMPTAARQRLNESQERIITTLPVQERLRPSKGAGSGFPVLPALLILGLASILLAGGVYLVTSGSSRPPPRTPRPSSVVPTTPSETPGESGDVAVTLADAKLTQRRLLEEGRYEQILATWEEVEPGPDEDPAEVKKIKQEKIAEFQRLLRDVRRLETALSSAQSRPGDDTVEAALARAVAEVDVRIDSLPARQELKNRRQARLQPARAAAEERLANAQGSARFRVAEWAPRAEQVSSKSPRVRGLIKGQLVTGLALKAVDAGGYSIEYLDQGQQRRPLRRRWGEDPLTDYLVWTDGLEERTADDRLEGLRLALLARDEASAAEAAQGLGFAELDVRGLIGSAPLSARPVKGEGERVELFYPTWWVPHDLELSSGQPGQLSSRARDLVLKASEGSEARVQSWILPLKGNSLPAELTAGVDLAAGSEGWVELSLAEAERRRSFRIRWSGSAWSLDADYGGGWTLDVRQGQLSRGISPTRVGLELAGKRIVPVIGGVTQADKSVSAKNYDALGVGFGVLQGELRIRLLRLSAPLDTEVLERDEERYRLRVERTADSLGMRLPRPTAKPLAPLPLEDPQGLALLDEEQRRGLALARAKLAQNAPGAARQALAGLPSDMAVTLYYRGLAAAQGGELAVANRLLEQATTAAAGFPEAQALRAYVLARSGRLEQSKSLAELALAERADLAHAYLALAVSKLLLRNAAAGAGLETIEPEFELPLALAPRHPLVAQESYRLRLLQALEASLPQRSSGDAHVLFGPQRAGADGKAEEAALARLDRLRLEMARAIGQGSAGTPLETLVYVVGPQGLRDLAPPGSDSGQATQPRYDETLDVILLGELPAPKVSADPMEDYPLTVAAARATLARLAGAPAPWLAESLPWVLASAQLNTPPPELPLLDTRAGAWSKDRWEQEVLRLRRAELLSNRVALAKAWNLANGLRTSPEISREIRGALADSAKARPSDLRPFLALDLERIDQIGK